MSMYNRDTLLGDLRNNVVEVHFTKADGTQRVMICTLMQRLLPESYQRDPGERATENEFHQRNADTIATWDIRANAWRSFRIDSVYYAQAKENY